MGKWDSATATVEGGIPTASASAGGWSLKATAAISVNASLLNNNLALGTLSINVGYSVAINTIAVTVAGIASVTNGISVKANATKNEVTGLSNGLNAVENTINASENGVNGLKNGVGAVTTDTNGVKVDI